MRRAIELAKCGAGMVSPNPLVGAVIVKDNVIIGEGYHACYGGLHAERNALNNCTGSPEGAVMYVTLEPCCHYGKTPPCTKAIIDSGIRRVAAGCLDPNPLVAGKGIKELRAAGLTADVGVLEDECRELAEVFFHYTTAKMPYITMKYAMTADGKTGTYQGDSKWITGTQARAHVHLERKRNKGIMVGVGTVLSDNPMLDCRCENPVNPIRIVCDSRLRIPLDSQIVQTAKTIPTIVAAVHGDINKQRQLEALGVEVIFTPPKNNRIDLYELAKICAGKGIDSILLEGGGGLNASALEAGLISKVQVYLGAKLIGGLDAKMPVGGKGIALMDRCIKLERRNIMLFEEDVFIEYNVKNPEVS